MATLTVPEWDPEEPWPTLGPQVCALIEERMIFGPGSLQGQPAKIDDDGRGAIYSFYEVYPKGHQWAGRRRYKRCSYCVRKGLAKTEKMAWIALCELHPEGPVRCDGFDAYGQPVGRPVVSPYIPLLAVSVKQVEELAYGALKYMVDEGPDQALFDSTDERVIRLSPSGGEDGKCLPLSNSPGARDGARTSFQGFDEPHRLILPRQRAAHETMLGNMSKRPLEDPWSLYVGTAGEPGEGSIAEDVHHEAEAIAKGEQSDPRLWAFYRWAGGEYNLDVQEERVQAVIEATGPAGEFGPGQFDDIAAQWSRKGADKQYLERVWLNRWVRSNEQVFSPVRRKDLIVKDDPFVPGAFVTAGFDGARFKDSTGIVLTDIPTGRQMLWALFERQEIAIDPDTGEPELWEIDESLVTLAVEQMMSRFHVWRFNCDPPHWTETVASWADRWPTTTFMTADGKTHTQSTVEEWWTHRKWPMARAVRAYKEAMDTGNVTFLDDTRDYTGTPEKKAETYEEAFARHMAAAGRHDIHMEDDDGKKLFVLRKLHETRKFDAQMAAVLSWEARLEALKKGAQKPKRRSTRVQRL